MSYESFFYRQDFSYLKPIGFGFGQCEPSYSIGARIRDHWVLHFVVSGRGVFIKNSKIHHIKPGEIFVIPPFTETYYEADKDDPWYYIWVDFSADETISQVLNGPVIRLSGARRYFESVKLAANMGNGKMAYLAGCIWDFLACLYENKEEKVDHIRSAEAYIGANYMHDISVASVADYLKLDRTYFSTLFKKRMGISPKQYINEVRLKQAVLLMTEHGASLSAVSENVGFCDVSYFTKVFKARYGCPPREYVKKYCRNK